MSSKLESDVCCRLQVAPSGESYEGKRRPGRKQWQTIWLGIWRDSLHITCGLTACTPRSAQGPTLGNEYGKTCGNTQHDALVSETDSLHETLAETKQQVVTTFCQARGYRPTSQVAGTRNELWKSCSIYIHCVS